MHVRFAVKVQAVDTTKWAGGHVSSRDERGVAVGRWRWRRRWRHVVAVRATVVNVNVAAAPSGELVAAVVLNFAARLIVALVRRRHYTPKTDSQCSIWQKKSMGVDGWRATYGWGAASITFSSSGGLTHSRTFPRQIEHCRQCLLYSYTWRTEKGKDIVKKIWGEKIVNSYAKLLITKSAHLARNASQTVWRPSFAQTRWGILQTTDPPARLKVHNPRKEKEDGT